MRRLAPLLVLLAAACGDAPEPTVPETAPPPPATVAQETLLDPASATLDRAHQERLWAVEHTAFELETFFGKPFVRLLAKGNVRAAKNHLRDDLVASAPATPTVERAVGRVGERVRTAGERMESLDRDGLMARLKRAFDDSSFGLDTGSSARVLHLERDDDDLDRWTSIWLMTVRGQLSARGPGLATYPIEIEWTSRISFRFADDHEIRTQPVVTEWRVEREVIRSAYTLMLDATDASGLAALPLLDNWNAPVADRQQYTFQSAVADYDRDGDLDIAIASRSGGPFLMRNDGKARFANFTREAGVRGWMNDWAYGGTTLAGWFDLDDDGFPDLVLGRRLYRNRGDGTFEDVTAASGLKIATDPTGCIVADYDGDGLQDLYVLYKRSPQGGGAARTWIDDGDNGVQNVLWRNRGDGTLEDVTEQANASGGARMSFAAAFLHANDDAHPDLYVANDFGRNVLLLGGANGVFTEAPDSGGASDYATSMGVAAGDVDGDGRTDLYVANMFSKMGRRVLAHVGPNDYPAGIYDKLFGSCSGNRLYVGGDAGFSEVSDARDVNGVGWAYAPAMADLDGNGTLDLYATTGFMSMTRDKPDG